MLAIPQSSKLGEQFKLLGVNNVVTFDFEGDFDQKLHTYRYNYILHFCTHFYKCLVDEKTVIEAFNQAIYYVSVDTIIEEIWEKRQITHDNLGIKPVLLGGDYWPNKQRLFDR